MSAAESGGGLVRSRPANRPATASASSRRIPRSRPWWARLERALRGGVVDRHPVDQEPFAELRHHGVMLVEHRGRAGEQADAAFPVQAAAAVDADEAASMSRRRARAARRARAPRASRCIERIEPKSLRTMMPRSPISRSRPPLAPALASLRGVPLRSAASVSVATTWTPSSLLVALNASVLPLPAAPTRISQVGSNALDAVGGDGGAGDVDGRRGRAGAASGGTPRAPSSIGCGRRGRRSRIAVSGSGAIVLASATLSSSLSSSGGVASQVELAQRRQDLLAGQAGAFQLPGHGEHRRAPFPFGDRPRRPSRVAPLPLLLRLGEPGRARLERRRVGRSHLYRLPLAWTRGRRDDVAAVAAHVEAGAELAGRVAHLDAGMA